jgi:protein-disulfide isomerase
MTTKNDSKTPILLGVTVGVLIVMVLQLVGVSNSLNAIEGALGGDVEVAAGAVAAAQAAGEANQPSAPAANPTPTTDMVALSDDDAVKGDPDAPVTIVEWSDFECPFCGRFYENTLPQIEEQYINTGKAKLVYRDYPLSFHRNAQKSAEATECAGEQGKFWEMHDKLFESGVTGGVDAFKQYAVELGLDTASFNSCLDSGQMAAEVQKDMAEGQANGIRGTPGFIINGKVISGAQPFAAFQQVIEAELAQ